MWWYGLGFALGFWQMHRYIQRHRVSLRLDARDGFALSLMVIAGVLAGGRAIEILFDEWPFYRNHVSFMPRYWLGGMATHGLLIGAAVGCGLFCAIYKRSLLRVADALVIPGPSSWGSAASATSSTARLADHRCRVGGEVPGRRRVSASSGALRRTEEPAARAVLMRVRPRIPRPGPRPRDSCSGTCSCASSSICSATTPRTAWHSAPARR